MQGLEEPERRNRWLGVELRHFAALGAVASERSFRGAAERLGYVQSAISRQIAYLEELTGARLIERSRGPKPVALTEAGRLLLAHANHILESLDAARRDVGGLSTGEVGEVRVGLIPGVPAAVLPPALVAFGKRHPGVRVTALQEVTDAPMFDLVRNGDIDLGFVHLPVPPGPFAVYELLRVPWALIVAADDELALRDTPPTMSEIARLPLIGSTSPRMEPEIESRLSAEVRDPRIVFRCDLPYVVQALAAGGVGAAILPRLAVNEDDPRIAVIDLSELLPPARFGLVWLRHRRLGRAVIEFRDIVRQVAANLDQHGDAQRRFERGPAAPWTPMLEAPV